MTNLKYVEFYGTLEKSNNTLIRKINRFLYDTPILEIAISNKKFIIDVENIFNRKFLCDKDNCDMIIKYKNDNPLNDIEFIDGSCCETGSYKMSKETEEYIDNHLDKILPYLSGKNQDYIREYGWKYNKQDYDDNSTDFTDYDLCIFSFIENEMSYCALHRYALDNNIDILEVKPFDCFMFPLDIIKYNNKYILTTVSNDSRNADFSRWRDYHCFNKCIINKDKGVPMYEHSKDVLVKLYGKELYDKLDEIYKSDEWKKLLK